MALFRRKPEIEELVKSVAVLDCQPDDVLVIESERRIPRDVYNKLQTQLKEHTGCRVLLLEAGLELRGVIRGAS